VDITDTFEAKVRAMEAYKSQHQAVFGIRDQLEAALYSAESMAGALIKAGRDGNSE